MKPLQSKGNKRDRKPKTLADFVTEARSRIREIGPAELCGLICDKDDLLIVDVREPDEFTEEHIANSILIPRGTLEAAADLVNKRRVRPLCDAQERPVVLYCDTGARSAMAADTLQQMGFREVYSLAGGLAVWSAEELPVIKESLSSAWIT